GQIVELVDPLKLGLDDAGIPALHDLLVEVITFCATGDFNKGRQPVVRCEDVVQDGARLDFARPANDTRSAHAALPGGQLATLEGRVATIGVGDHFGAIVGGKDQNRVVELAHVFEFLDHIADVVVHLLHAGFVDAPVLAAGRPYHRHVLVRQHGGDVHARRVVPDEERLVGL